MSYDSLLSFSLSQAQNCAPRSEKSGEKMKNLAYMMNMEVAQTVARGNNECYNLHYDFSLSAKIIGLTPRAPIMNAHSSSKVNKLRNIFKTTRCRHGKFSRQKKSGSKTGNGT